MLFSLFFSFLSAPPAMTDAALTFRVVRSPISPADIKAVAALHYASWRMAYVDVFPSEYLNGGGLQQQMAAMWSGRAATAIPDAAQWHLVLAEAAGELAGFVCVNATEEREHGVLLDNLHVAKAFRRRGIARKLVGYAAAFVAQGFPGEPMHLTCLSTNKVARPFYEALGGELRDGPVWRPEGGTPTPCVRYVWQPEQLGALAEAAK